MRIAKTAVIIIVIGIIIPIVVEAGLVIYGLQQMRVGEAEIKGDTVVIPLTVPNRGFVDLGGMMKISILDQGGMMLESTDNFFTVPAGKTETILLTVKMPKSGEPSKVRMESIFDIAGLLAIPIPAVEAGIPI